MSSMVRRIQRSVKRRGKARFYQGRGSKLGVTNAVARKPHAVRGSRRGVQTYLKGVIVRYRVGPTSPRARRDIAAHQHKMVGIRRRVRL